MKAKDLILTVSVFFVGALKDNAVIMRAQEFTQPPKNTAAALGTNATFSCHGNTSEYHIIWEVSGTQIREETKVEEFAGHGVYAPLPKMNFSELIVEATRDNNHSREIKCILGPIRGLGNTLPSETVMLLVYAEPYPPMNLRLENDSLNIVATWTEPFSLEGEEISYVIFITNLATMSTHKDIIINMSRYILNISIGIRDCAEYLFTVWSKNGYSRSNGNITGWLHIPTKPLVMTTSDVQISVSLQRGVRATIHFNPRDPCPWYPVTSYEFSITEKESNNHVRTVRHTGNKSLTLDSGSGLVSDQIYLIIIESENSVGSTQSEDILLYTTGLQSSKAVIEPDGSITFTCTFALGATSTGCQVTILMMDGVQVLLSRNITRRSATINEATENLFIPGLNEDSMLLVQVSELLREGIISRVLFNTTVMVSTLLRMTAIQVVESAEDSVPSWIIVVAVVMALLVVLLVVLLVIIIICCKKYTKTSRNVRVCINPLYGEQNQGHSADNIKAIPNEVYGVIQESQKLQDNWQRSNDPNDSNYCYITLEQRTYETINDIQSQGNRYITTEGQNQPEIKQENELQ